MDLGPITGIRSVSLLSPRKTEKEDAPHFEIDASAHAGDESFSSSQEAPERSAEDKEANNGEQTSLESQQEEALSDSEGHHSWFV